MIKNYSGDGPKLPGLGSLLAQGAKHPSFDPVYESEAMLTARRLSENVND
ncbi:MAG: hypothetical protein U9Q39_07665 [Pseudomonadota bacterium]|nr:hypothetical protein [Pseudomonadota bacterium]